MRRWVLNNFHQFFVYFCAALRRDWDKSCPMFVKYTWESGDCHLLGNNDSNLVTFLLSSFYFRFASAVMNTPKQITGNCFPKNYRQKCMCSSWQLDYSKGGKERKTLNTTYYNLVFRIHSNSYCYMQYNTEKTPKYKAKSQCQTLGQSQADSSLLLL